MEEGPLHVSRKIDLHEKCLTSGRQTAGCVRWVWLIMLFENEQVSNMHSHIRIVYIYIAMYEMLSGM